MSANDQAYQRLAMKIFADMSASIAAPCVLAALIGKELDRSYGSGHIFLFLLLALAAILTAISLTKKARRYQQEYQRLNMMK